MVRLAIWNLKPHDLTVLQRSDLFRSIRQLSMDRFLDCLCDKNYQSLIITDTAPEEELHQTWVLLLHEYHENKGETTESGMQWRLQRDINRLQNHLFLLQLCISFLDSRWSESIADSLNRLGYTFKPAEPDPEKYKHLLAQVIARSKTKFILLQGLIKELERKMEASPNKPPTRDYFDNMLIQLEEMQKTSYSFETLTVHKFLTLEAKYWKMIEQLNEARAK